MFKYRDYTIPLLLIVAFAGSVISLYATRWCIGLSPDSTGYIAAAHNLAAGGCLCEVRSEPAVEYPPLYPVLLAVLERLGLDPVDGARWLNASLLAGNIFLVGLVIRLNTSNSVFAPILGSVLMMSSFGILKIHSMAWTEPLFIFFTLLGALALGAFISNPKQPILVFAAILVGLACLTRYAGLSLIITGVVGMLIMSRKSFAEIILDSVIFVGISVFPMALWMLRNFYLSGSMTGRTFEFHLISLGHVRTALLTISHWLVPLPPEAPYDLRIALVLGVVLIPIILLTRKAQRGSGVNCIPIIKHLKETPLLFGIFILVYMGFLIVSISFFDFVTPLDYRILSPVYVSALIFALCLTYKVFALAQEEWGLRTSAKGLGIALALVYIASGGAWLMLRSDGHVAGWSSNNWRASERILLN